ncbi:hypothetical protein ROJ8625_03760 [Roseivivax jejudonensis]|uniref:AAA+ ATPase domain-containing protein n=1 Tax=Roseivivax jejudonensis TaxID=1529041 RepID=A0A1X7A7D7_9RHOB|nr:ATP-binding protein [Roseivivax jejudonensis]SLN71972.1 hypothetical protein ROJ8625_03760 [Roseivivax jejudonensis]
MSEDRTQFVLSEGARIRLASDTKARLASLFFPTDDYREVMKKVFQVLQAREASMALGRMVATGVVVVGPSGAGKSRLIEEVVKDYETFACGGVAQKFGTNIVTSVVPGKASIKAMLERLLRDLGYPIQRNLSENELQSRLVFQLKEQRIAALHLDEVQDVGRHRTDDSYDRFTKKFRNLMQDQDWPVCLILSATPEVKTFINHDRTLTRRLLAHEMNSPKMKDSGTLRCATNTLLAEAGLRDVGLLSFDGFFEILRHAACDCFGQSIHLTIQAMGLAKEQGAELIDADHFAEAYSIETNCADDHNPFIVQEWHLIDTRKAMERARREDL